MMRTVSSADEETVSSWFEVCKDLVLNFQVLTQTKACTYQFIISHQMKLQGMCSKSS